MQMLSVGEFLVEFAEMVERDPSTLTLETELKDIGTWDSLSQVSFMAMLDERFSKSVNPDRLDDAETVGDLWRLATG